MMNPLACEQDSIASKRSACTELPFSLTLRHNLPSVHNDLDDLEDAEITSRQYNLPLVG